MRKPAHGKNAGRWRRVAGFWCLAAVLGAALIVMPLALGGQKVQLKGTEGGRGSANSPGIWDEVDAEIDLSGLWGSIDPDNDVDPFVYTEPITGNVHLFWASWNGEFYEIAHAERPLGSVWNGMELVQAVAPDSRDNLTPRAIRDALGLLHVSWARKGSFTSSVYHAVRVSGGWTEPSLLSGMEMASEPFPWLDDNRTMVDYQTPMEIVTVEITVSIGDYSGGSDDIDPSQVTVESEIVMRTLVPQ